MQTKYGPIHRYIHHHAKRGFWHVVDHAIPHDGNKYHPHLLKHRALFGYSIVLILLKVVVLVAPLALPSSSLYSSAITQKNIIDLTNQTRNNLGLPPLVANQTLAVAATAKAANLLEEQYFAHNSPTGKTPWQWIREAGYRYRHAGENLAVHFHEAEDVLGGWMASPTHRANIVSEKYSEIGIGVATGEYEGVPATFVVQMFGRPLAVAAAVVPAQVPVELKTKEVQAVPKPSNETNKPAAEQQKLEEKKLAPVRPTPQPQPAPTPTPTPIAEPAPATQPEPLPVVAAAPNLIEEAKVEIVQKAETYALMVTADAEVAQAQLAGEQATLTQVETGQFAGEIDYNANVFHESGEPLVLTLVPEEGLPETESVAILSPTANTQQFYIFNEGADRYTTLAGKLRIGNLDDKVRQFYFAFSVFLAAGVLLYLFVLKLRIHHPSVVAHTLAVAGLGILLLVI